MDLPEMDFILDDEDIETDEGVGNVELGDADLDNLQAMGGVGAIPVMEGTAGVHGFYEEVDDDDVAVDIAGLGRFSVAEEPELEAPEVLVPAGVGDPSLQQKAIYNTERETSRPHYSGGAWTNAQQMGASRANLLSALNDGWWTRPGSGFNGPWDPRLADMILKLQRRFSRKYPKIGGGGTWHAYSGSNTGVMNRPTLTLIWAIIRGVPNSADARLLQRTFLIASAAPSQGRRGKTPIELVNEIGFALPPIERVRPYPNFVREYTRAMHRLLDILAPGAKSTLTDLPFGVAVSPRTGKNILVAGGNRGMTAAQAKIYRGARKWMYRNVHSAVGLPGLFTWPQLLEPEGDYPRELNSAGVLAKLVAGLPVLTRRYDKVAEPTRNQLAWASAMLAEEERRRVAAVQAKQRQEAEAARSKAITTRAIASRATRGVATQAIRSGATLVDPNPTIRLMQENARRRAEAEQAAAREAFVRGGGFGPPSRVPQLTPGQPEPESAPPPQETAPPPDPQVRWFDDPVLDAGPVDDPGGGGQYPEGTPGTEEEGGMPKWLLPLGIAAAAGYFIFNS